MGAGAQRVLGDEYPRYAALCEQYGEPNIKRASAAEAESEAGTLEARLVLFTFYIRSSSSSDPSSSPGKTVAAAESEHRQELLIPRTVNVYRLKGIVGRAFGIRPMGCRLVWETGEWDPMSGPEIDGHDDGEWSCDGSEEEGEERGREKKGRWVRREVELVDGMRAVGFWIEGREARVRVERR